MWNILCGRFHSTLMIQSPVLDSLWTWQKVLHTNAVFSLMTEWFSPGNDQSCLPCSDFPWIVLSNILNRIATNFFPCNLKYNYFSLLWTFCQYSYVEVLLKSLVYLCNWIRSRCKFLRRNFCQFWWWKLLRNYSYDKPMENNELLMQLAKLSWERNRGWCFFSGFLRLDLNICCNRIQEWIEHFTDAI